MAQVRGAVCANINLLMEKEEEDFEKYLPTFAADVWGLLTGVTLEPAQVRAVGCCSKNLNFHAGIAMGRHCMQAGPLGTLQYRGLP